MELYQLRSFVAVAREGALTRAAEKVYASQSAVSGHIKSLEDELGVHLFRRTAKGMELTPAGRQLLDKAAAILETAESLAREAASLRDEVRGVLRVSVNTDFSYLRLASIGRRLAARWPELEVHYLLTQSHLTPGLVQSGEVDLGFLFGNWSHKASEDMRFVELDSTPLRIIGPVEWADQLAVLDLLEIMRLPWITNPTTCPHFEVTRRVFAEHNLSPKVAGVTDSEDVLIELASQGMGVTVVKESDALTHAAAGRVAMWPHVFSTLPLSLAVLSQRMQEAAPKAFLDEAIAVWKEEAPAKPHSSCAR
ncbi:MAG: LysR family transcriptional regulator [Desulfovibrio sp.]|nr:LysR family transcriptional regulator [Desulfovibrio sp.]